MAGCHLGATAKIKKVPNKNLLSTHCIYCCEHIASQKLSPELNDIMIRPVKIINYSLLSIYMLLFALKLLICHLSFLLATRWRNSSLS